ncbi:MAG: SPOR domain-containing protein [Gemmatimonadaceae bacterium]|nr:SPOR domain-containing protein [Gemmatimonadaceae bacterium]
MRYAFFALFAGLLLACARESESPQGRATTMSAGPDPVVVRIPRNGGTARAYRFASLDSTIWRSSQAAPAVERVLAFDAENGLLAIADSAGQPGWVDLRLGTVRRPPRAAFSSLVSADGWSVYGITGKNEIVRMTPSGDWQQSPRRKVRRLIPTPDGTVLAVLDAGKGEGMLVRLRPPDDEVTDSVAIPLAERAAITPVGDRVYLGAGPDLLSVLPDEVAQVQRYTADDDILAMAPTPSGDRVFVANKGSARLERFDRYANDLAGSVRLPGLITELRMDPLGRYLLARPVHGDSAWVVSVGTETLVGVVRTSWRADLPVVAFDGSVVTLRGSNVAFVEPTTNKVVRTVAKGGDDTWFFTRWNGFRPRARGIDQPVSFRTGASEVAPVIAPPAGTTATPPVDTATIDPPAPTPAVPVTPALRARTGWTLSFAAVLSLDRAREIAASINVRGERPRVVTGDANGTPIYRVVLGPFDSRDEAERAGKASGHSFWIFEGAP